MYSPPPGYVDLLADAEPYTFLGDLIALDVPGVGCVQARRPKAFGVAALAMSGSPDLSGPDRTRYMVQFVSDHLDEGEVERLYFEMMMDTLPTNTVERVARALSTWGTSRPYVAVATLAVMTGHHWRTLRQRLLSSGVTRPMTLESMHALLDFTEHTIVESMSNGQDAEHDVASFYRSLYGPTLGDDDSDMPVPAGFRPEEVEASFDAFARAAR